MQAIMDIAVSLALEDGKPLPLLTGKHFIDMGLKPAPQFGKLLKVAFETQLDGVFSDVAGATAFAASLLR